MYVVVEQYNIPTYFIILQIFLNEQIIFLV